jgi:class 3 adenylate cyclase/tetratricopeptide (TPR) repeat protein
VPTGCNNSEADERQRLQTLLGTIIPYLPRPVVEQQLDAPKLGQVRGEYWEGSLLFADLSGFTALSESLSLLGTRGAEEITRIVNDLFTALLVDVERYGGVLVKFGGDALTAFFGGSEHELRAVVAASVLQEVMQERFVNLDTLGGFFTLRLRVGVHAGRIFAAHVGYEPGYPLRGMELVVTGPDVNRVAQAQDQAAPGEICITADVLERIHDVVGVEPVAGSVYRMVRIDRSSCAATPQAEPMVIDLPDWSATRMRLLLDALGPYLPVDFTDERNSDPTDPELRPGLRPVAVLFANFVGYSTILRTLADKGEAGVHLATAILNAYYARMQDVIGRYGGVVNKVDMHTEGDKLMALFGAPRSHGDDVERAVRAALEMQAVMVDVNQHIRDMLELIGAPVTNVRQRIGINYGHVFAGNVGSDLAGSRREYTVMGDAVNLAARLMSAATEGEILISPTVRRQISERFEIVDLSPILVKGKTEPILVSRPARPLTLRERSAIRRGRRPFIGRERQREALTSAARRILAGQGQVAVIVGEVGTGKSRLVEEFQIQLASGVDFSDVRCFVTELPSYAQEPYAPFIDLFRRLVALGSRPTDDANRLRAWVETRVPNLDHFLPLLGDLLAIPIGDNQVTAALTREQRRDRLFDLVEAVLHSDARSHPLVLVVDDLQWADTASLALIERLAQGIAQCPIFLVLCYRPDASFSTPWAQLDHAVVVDVDEFAPEESAHLIRELLASDDVPENLTELVWSRAHGNPFFIEEFVKSLREMEAITRVDGRWRLASEETAMTAIPDTIEGIVLARLDHLEVRCREVLQEVSVAATSQVRIPGVLVERVDPFVTDLPRRLRTLVADGLLEALELELEELAYHFRHTLTRDVAYDTLLHARRRELHGLFAQAMETLYADRLDEQVTALAHHCVQAEDWPRAFSYLRRAGVRAQLLFANRDAISNYEQALATAEKHLPDMLLAMKEEQLGRALSDVHELLGDVLEVEGRYDESLQHYALARTMVAADERSDDQVRRLAGLCRKSAVVHERRSEYDLAFKWLEHGLSNLDREKPTIEEARIFLLGAGVFQRQGTNEDAIRWCQRGLDVALKIGSREALQTVAQAYYNLGGIHIRQGDSAMAVEFCRKSIQVYQDIGDIVGQSQPQINLANAYLELGSWQQATDHYLQALEIKRRIGDVYTQAVITLNLGGVYLNQGNLDEATDSYVRSLEMWRKLGSTYPIALLHNNLAAVALRRGDGTQALELLKESEELFREIGSNDFMAEVYRHRAEAHLFCGDLDAALECAQDSLSQALAQEMRLEEGMTRRVLGQVFLAREELVEADEQLRASLKILDDLDSRYEAAQTLVQKALLYHGQGYVAEAAGSLERAIAIFEELGAQLDLAQAQSLRDTLS